MAASSFGTVQHPASTALQLERIGVAVIRYGLALIIGWIWALTFVPKKAAAIGLIHAVWHLPLFDETLLHDSRSFIERARSAGSTCASTCSPASSTRSEWPPDARRSRRRDPTPRRIGPSPAGPGTAAVRKLIESTLVSLDG